MPHVVLDGPVDLRAYAREFRPLLLRRGRDVLRADRIYVEREGDSLLIEALAVEAGRKQPFYLKISTHERGDQRSRSAASLPAPPSATTSTWSRSMINTWMMSSGPVVGSRAHLRPRLRWSDGLRRIPGAPVKSSK